MDQKLIDLVKLAGQLALNEQKTMVVSTKADTSIVTTGDIAVSKFLEVELKKLYPDYEIFSEENSGVKPVGQKIIVIDPIDGTQSYSRNQDTWTILIGFLDNNVPVKGIVYQPTTERLWIGEKGQGSFYVHPDGLTTRLIANNNQPLNLKAWTSPTLDSEDKFLDKLNISNRETSFSASLKIMYLSQGDGDIYPNFRCKCSLWDLVAPLVILQEAGGDLVFEKHSTLPINFINPHINSKFYAVGQKMKIANYFKV